MSYMKIVLFSLVFLMPACTTTKNERKQFWLDYYEGEIVPTAAVMQDLKQSQVIFVGESHRISRHHEWQLEILKQLHSAGEPVALGLEMIERQYQPALDRYNKKEIDFETLAKEIDWEKRWSNFSSYQPLVEFAGQNGIPVLALNARLEIVRQVGRKGLSSLNQEQQKELPRMNNWSNDPIYRKHLDKLMMVHMSVDEARLEKIFQAQVLRDETMAEVVVDYLKDHTEHKVMCVTGSGHINYSLGIPQRVRREIKGLRDRIVMFTVSGELVLTEEEKQQSRPITIRHQDLKFIPSPLCDYLHVMERRE